MLGVMLSVSSLFSQYQITKCIFGNGSDRASNESYSICTSIGQPLIGQSKNTSYTCKVGFWIRSSEITNADEKQLNQISKSCLLFQNYPNPFNPMTTIEYELPKSAHVRLVIYDLAGRRVRTLVDTKKQAGHFQTTWDGTDELDTPVATGMYICRMKTKDNVKVIKLSLVK